MNYRIEDTRLPGRIAALNDTVRPYAVIAERSWNAVISRHETKAAAQAKVRRLKAAG